MQQPPPPGAHGQAPVNQPVHAAAIPNLFARMRQGALANPNPDPTVANRKRKKFERIVHGKAQLTAKRAEQRGANQLNRKRERDADANEIMHQSASVPLQRSWLAPIPKHGSDNTKDLSLFVVGHKSAEVLAQDCPAGMIQTHKNERRMGMSRTMQDPRAKFAQQMKEEKAPSQVKVSENRLDTVDVDGCPSMVRVHGHEHAFYVRAPQDLASEILRAAFPVEMRDAKNAARIPLPPVPAPADLHRVKEIEPRPKGWMWRETKAEKEARMAEEKARESRNQAYLHHKMVTWQQVRKQRDNVLINHSRAVRWGNALRDAIEAHLEQEKSLDFCSGGFMYHLVSSVTPVLRQSVVGFDFDEQSLYYKITLPLPRVRNAILKLLTEQGVTVEHQLHKFTDDDMGNAEIDADLQFLVGNNLAGQSWITLPAGKYKITTGQVPAEMMHRVGEKTHEYQADRACAKQENKEEEGSDDEEQPGAPGNKFKKTRVQIGYQEEPVAAGGPNVNARKTWYRTEIDINYKDLVSHYKEKGKWERIVPLRTLSIDIECLDGDTQVAIEGGTSMRIKDVEPGMKVLAYDPRTNGLVPRTVTHHLPRGDKQCIELLFSDGRKITCTRDHKILTANGEFMEADRLCVGEAEVLAGIEYPCVSPTEDEGRCATWSLDLTASLGVKLDMMEKRRETLAFARLLGYLLTDGSLPTLRENRNNGEAKLFMGHELDRRAACDDIKTLVGHDPYWLIDKGLIHVTVRDELYRAFVEVGVPVGARIGNLSHLPDFILDEACPLPVLREFLGAYFGGDGSTICLGRSGKSVLFSPIGFTMSKKGVCAREQQHLLRSELYPLLEKCGVSTEGIRSFLTETITKVNRPKDQAERKENGQVVSPVLADVTPLKEDTSYAIQLNFPASACLPFHQNIGFRYSCHKQMRLTAGCTYWRQAELINVQRKAIASRVEALMVGPKAPSLPRALRDAKEAESQMSTLHPLVMAWVPNHKKALWKKAKGNLILGRREILNALDIDKFFSEKRKKRKYSAAFREHEIATEAAGLGAPEENFTGEDVQTRYGVHADARTLPTFRVKLLAKRDVGVREVFDLSVPVESAPEDDTWDSFTANGVVVHNCAAQKKGRFPVANPKTEHGFEDHNEPGDPIISISAVLQEGSDNRRRKTILTYRLPGDRFDPNIHKEDPDDIEMYDQDCEVWMYKDEEDMMIGFSELMRSCQPSVLVGYNSNRFDLPYLIDRATKLGLENFAFLSAVKELTTIKKSTYQSKAAGTQERIEPIIPGVLNFDLCSYIIQTEKMSSYTLNAVAAKITGKTKADLHHSLIAKMFYGTRAQRKRLFKYNLIDSLLPLDIIEKLKVNFGLAEIARVCGVTNTTLLTKGQGIKTESQLHRLMLQHGFVAPILPHKNKGQEITTMEEMIEAEEVQYEGAICVEPQVGLYEDPIVTEDYASLYPSEMLCYNLDYSTILLNPERDLPRLSIDDYYTIDCPRATPEDPNAKQTYYYVKRHVREGVCPLLLSNLLRERGEVKQALKKVEEHSEEESILNSRSTALKLSANSTYGFCAGFVLHLPAISECVCAMGRADLLKTIELIEGYFCIANGFAHDAKVIYGDTDSVMIKFGVKTVKLASDLGFEAQSLINEMFIDRRPMAVEFEKVYCPYLLMIKKHYAGIKYAPGTEASTYHYEPTHPQAIKNKCNYAPDVAGSYLPSLDYKGIEPKRRDKITFVKRVMTQALDYIFWERDKQKAINYCRDEITKLIQGEIDVSEIIKSKSYKAGQVGESPQSAVAEKIAMRDPANAPVSGSRVPWVPLILPGKGANAAKKFETAEDPMFALEHDLPIDYKDVAMSDVKNALHRLFKYCFFEEGKTIEANMELAEARMAPMFAPIQTARFIDDRPLGGPMAKFTRPVDTCRKCYSVIRLDEEQPADFDVAMTDARPDDPVFPMHWRGDMDEVGAAPLPMALGEILAMDAANGARRAQAARLGAQLPAIAPVRRPGARVVCVRCINHLPELKQQQSDKLVQIEEASKAIWDTCNKCMDEPLDCNNDDCKLFYKRKAVGKQMIAAKARLAKFTD